MYNPVYAVTDGKGNIRTITTDAKYKQPERPLDDPPDKYINHYGKCRLFELVTNYTTDVGDKFQLLGRHLLEKGYDRNEIVEYGTDRNLRSVLICGNHYRSKGYYIFEKVEVENERM